MLLLDFLALIALLLICSGAYRLHRAYRAHRAAQARAAYRAASLVVTERQRLRAGQHRAASAEWGRAA